WSLRGTIRIVKLTGSHFLTSNCISIASRSQDFCKLAVPAWYEHRAVSAFAHRSVLKAEVLQYLALRDHEVYIDCTVGGGGHAEAILEAARCRLIGIDRDPAAIAATRERLGDRLELVHGELGEIAAIVSELRLGQVNGLLLDLGVSSPQLDLAERGFSF